jgi:hypothetical protein
MLYHSCRLHGSGLINISTIIDLWKDVAHEVETIDESTCKIWQTIQAFSKDNTHSRVYSMNNQEQEIRQWQPVDMVAIASPCYLRLEQDWYRTTFTMISTKKEALESVRSFIEIIDGRVEPASLDHFLKQNQGLRVQAATLYERKSDYEAVLTYGQPVELGVLDNPESSSDLLSLSVAVNITDPLHVRILHVSKTEQQVGFSVESELQEDDGLIEKLFTLADRTFKGNSICD